MSKIVIGIDQSYKRTGITIMQGNEIRKTLSVDYLGCNNNSEKRQYLRVVLCKIISCHTNRLDDITVITERIRLRSQGFLSEAYIKATGALVSVIIDTFNPFYIPVYSVDVRSWKSQIVGTSKPKENKYGIDLHKWPTILYLKEEGLLKHIVEPYKGKSTKGVIKVNMGPTEGVINCKINDDVADSICIAKYGFLPKSKQKLKEEKF